jgi:UDP-N-acetylmuramate dehydrogenase
MTAPMDEKVLLKRFAQRLKKDVPLANLTTAKVGGAARYFLNAVNAAQLAEDVAFLWAEEIPFFILGSGSNILVSDAGVDCVVIHNKANHIHLVEKGDSSYVQAESGAILITAARQAALRGYTGLEWATTIPGTVGGAVYGNAGAYGASMQQHLLLVDILHRGKGCLSLNTEQMGYSYRSSALKREPGMAVILSARLAIKKGDKERIKELINEFSARRKQTQPPGPCIGSTFKNPAGDSAGRIIDSLGLKGTRVGGVQVSPVHANFFVNEGSASARDYYDLIHLVQRIVEEKTGIKLEPEFELIGDWKEQA